MNGSTFSVMKLFRKCNLFNIARAEHYTNSLTAGWPLRFWLMFQNRRPTEPIACVPRAPDDTANKLLFNPLLENKRQAIINN